MPALPRPIDSLEPAKGRPVAAALVALAVLLAGCVGTDADPGNASGTDGNPSDGSGTTGQGTGGSGEGGGASSDGAGAGNGGGAGGATWARFPSDAVDDIFDFAGTFQAQDHWYPGGMAQAAALGSYEASLHRYDITSMIPLDVPVRLRAEVLAPAVDQGTIAIWLNGPNGMFYTWDSSGAAAGQAWAETIVGVRQGDTAELIVAYQQVDDDPSFDYTATLHVQHDPSMVPAGVPVGLDLPGPEPGYVVANGGDVAADVVVWDPLDAPVGRVEVGGRGGVAFRGLGDQAPDGEYVFLLAEGGAEAMRLRPGNTPPASEGGAAPALRLLMQEFAVGQTQRVPAGQSLTWTFDVMRAPMQVGAALMQATLATDIALQVVAPSGDVVATMDTQPGGALTGWFLLTDMGAEGLTTGAYEATFTASQHVDADVAEMVSLYVR